MTWTEAIGAAEVIVGAVLIFLTAGAGWISFTHMMGPVGMVAVGCWLLQQEG
jgi:hypothetical protein